ncbi:MAG: bifunctional 4-hydroxy-2-oxoglutarate aldolase/2-dehydro-3-deoxy-phosphogluconate aldolase [Actinomycetota bacterium]
MTMPDTARLLGIVRYRSECDLASVLGALRQAGIRSLEVTLDTPGALRAIGEIAGAGGSIGAGTVLSGDQVRSSAEAGARFVVSPGLVEDVVRTALELDVEPIPGVLSATELLRARGMGASIVKVFPAGPAGGPALIAALRAPFPDVGLVPTGGIAIGDVSAYLAAGASAVGLGSALVGRRPPRSLAELDSLRDRARAAVEAAAAVRT